MFLLGLFLTHVFELFLDTEESDGDVLGGDAHHLSYLLITHILKPEQYDGAVEGSEACDTVAKHLHLS